MSLLGRSRRLARGIIARTARDVTAASATRSAVILAPHPDDETLGCGGLIQRKLAAGSAVTVVMVTDGRHSHSSSAITPEILAARRREELRIAAERLGLRADDVRWIDIEDGTVTANEDRLAAAIESMLTELRPDELYATCAEEPHPDHAAVGRAARRAARSAGGVAAFEYPIWLWGVWPLQQGHRIGSAVDALRRILGRRTVAVRTDGYAQAKMYALAAHQSQIARPKEVTLDEDWLVLPEPVMAAAGGRYELFFPVDLGR